MEGKKELIEAILDIELEMFLAVKAKEPVSCQEDPKSFRIHRGAQFSVWSEKTMRHYLYDLKRARKEGGNLMTLKYARMEGLIPRKNMNPLIEEIAVLHYKWQKEMFEKYPHMMAGARDLSSKDDSTYRTSFETYLKGELETYSDDTLASLYDDMLVKEEKGINMSEEVYQILVGKYGYNSVDLADEKIEKL